jgi:hypothetical protein
MTISHKPIRGRKGMTTPVQAGYEVSDTLWPSPLLSPVFGLVRSGIRPSAGGDTILQGNIAKHHKDLKYFEAAEVRTMLFLGRTDVDSRSEKMDTWLGLLQNAARFEGRQ